MIIDNNSEITLKMKGVDAKIIYEALDEIAWKYAPIKWVGRYPNQRVQRVPNGKKGRQVLSTFNYIEKQLEEQQDDNTR
ncbi:hypothetical protein D1Z98_01845 [Riemerella anatipestifer]|uniref:hypothetical protein n=1 Tax=Riemerella anatipestifer TaxID=34085 RepID=UPI00129D6740|nr:hypothetical protein [Riemerella anatipestifer]MRM93752.1 hypothetical protein [Riemerella anatipestifer]